MATHLVAIFLIKVTVLLNNNLFTTYNVDATCRVLHLATQQIVNLLALYPFISSMHVVPTKSKR